MSRNTIPDSLTKNSVGISWPPSLSRRGGVYLKSPEIKILVSRFPEFSGNARRFPKFPGNCRKSLRKYSIADGQNIVAPPLFPGGGSSGNLRKCPRGGAGNSQEAKKNIISIPRHPCLPPPLHKKNPTNTHKKRNLIFVHLFQLFFLPLK